MMRRVALLGLLCMAAGQAVAAQSVPLSSVETSVQADAVNLRGLDTLNGSTQDLSLRSGETRRFGHLEITVETCRVPRDDPAADAFAFLRIRDVREADPRFSGWMFASSPALSALDHPRYDVWVLSCSSS
jgi:hypothetical protein